MGKRLIMAMAYRIKRKGHWLKRTEQQVKATKKSGHGKEVIRLKRQGINTKGYLAKAMEPGVLG